MSRIYHSPETGRMYYLCDRTPSYEETRWGETRGRAGYEDGEPICEEMEALARKFMELLMKADMCPSIFYPKLIELSKKMPKSLVDACVKRVNK